VLIFAIIRLYRVDNTAA